MQVIPDLPEGLQSVFVCSCGSAWIPNAPVNALGRTRKYWTLLGGAVTHGDHCSEVLPFEFGYGFGSMTGDIDSNLAHRFDS